MKTTGDFIRELQELAAAWTRRDTDGKAAAGEAFDMAADELLGAVEMFEQARDVESVRADNLWRELGELARVLDLRPPRIDWPKKAARIRVAAEQGEQLRARLHRVLALPDGNENGPLDSCNTEGATVNETERGPYHAWALAGERLARETAAAAVAAMVAEGKTVRVAFCSCGKSGVAFRDDWGWWRFHCSTCGGGWSTNMSNPLRVTAPHYAWAICGERLARETAAAAHAAATEQARNEERERFEALWRELMETAQGCRRALEAETKNARAHRARVECGPTCATCRWVERMEAARAAARERVTAQPSPAHPSTWHPSTARHSSATRSALRPCSTAQPSSRASRVPWRGWRPKWPRPLGRALHTRQVAAACSGGTSEQYSEHSPRRGATQRKGKQIMSENREFRPEVPGVPKEGPLTPSTNNAENKPARDPQKSAGANSVPPGATEHPSPEPFARPVSALELELPAALRRTCRNLGRTLLDWPSLVTHGGLLGDPTMLDDAEREWMMAAADRVREALELASALEAVVTLPPDVHRHPVEVRRLGVTMPGFILCRHGSVAEVLCHGLGGRFWFSLRTGRPVLWRGEGPEPALEPASLEGVPRG